MPPYPPAGYPPSSSGFSGYPPYPPTNNPSFPTYPSFPTPYPPYTSSGFPTPPAGAGTGTIKDEHIRYEK